MSANLSVSLSANLSANLSGVTVAQLENAQKAIKNAGGLNASLSQFLKTGSKATATIGALAHVWAGVCATLADGQKSALLGFSKACKKDSPALNVLVKLSIVSEAGAVLAGVEAGFKGKQEKEMREKIESFIALVLVEQTRISEAAKSSKASKTTPEAAPEAEPEAAPEAEVLTPGQKDDQAVALIVARFNAGMLSTDNVALLLATLAPHGVKSAPKAKKALEVAPF